MSRAKEKRFGVTPFDIEHQLIRLDHYPKENNREPAY
jgi:hypothetical protein